MAIDPDKLEEVMAKHEGECQRCGDKLLFDMPELEKECALCDMRNDVNALLLCVNELYGDTRTPEVKFYWSRSHELLNALHRRVNGLE